MKKTKKTVTTARRASTLVSRAKLPAIRRREQLNAMLMVHDLERDRRPPVRLGDGDWAILRQIATEGAITNVGPAVRANAIYYLAKSVTVENVNVLSQLAQQGEDFYVRSYAMLALGRTGLHLSAPLLAAGLDAEERTERLAAEQGLAALGQLAGVGVVRGVLRDPQRREALARVEALIASRSVDAPRRARATTRRTTTQLRREG